VPAEGVSHHHHHHHHHPTLLVSLAFPALKFQATLCVLDGANTHMPPGSLLPPRPWQAIARIPLAISIVILRKAWEPHAHPTHPLASRSCNDVRGVGLGATALASALVVLTNLQSMEIR
jgi:hypothetical protein